MTDDPQRDLGSAFIHGDLLREQARKIDTGGGAFYEFHVHIGEEWPRPSAAAEVPLRNPYKALSAFTFDDATDFFGRDAEVSELVAALMPSEGPQPGDRFLAVVGASGSGKSSVVRAGLIPRLYAGAVQGVPLWVVVRITPGEYPLEALATQLGAADNLKAITPLDLQRDLGADERGLYRLAEPSSPRRAARRRKAMRTGPCACWRANWWNWEWWQASRTRPCARRSKKRPEAMAAAGVVHSRSQRRVCRVHGGCAGSV